MTSVCLADRSGDAAHKVRAADDFLLSPGECTSLMVLLLALLYNAIETLCEIFKNLMQAGYVLYEFYFRRLKEPH